MRCFVWISALFLIALLAVPSDAWWRRRRRRRDPCANQRHDCVWVWGSCSRHCGGGTQKPVITKNRGSCGKCNLPHTRNCNTQCCPVNCQWGSWGSLGGCSATCGGGHQTKHRKVVIVQKCGGRSCSGSSTYTQSCNTQCCPSNCVWGKWDSFGTCSKTCGGGTQVRSRKVTTKETCNGHCPGLSTESQVCNKECCPMNCQWGVWGPFAPCSKTCGGGSQSRRRKIVKPSSCGGKSCVGPDIDTVGCSKHCCPVNCKWGPWSKFLDCSVSCGGGVQHRSRVPIVTATCGGADCVGQSLETQDCMKNCCPKDCKWDSWGAFGSCSATCGVGTHKRSRKLIEKQSCGGACSGSNEETHTCESACCSVDCRWGSWGEYGSCSASCGGGNQSRSRGFEVASSCGGTPCNGPSKQLRRCNNKCCPEDCKWGPWGYFGPCSAKCGGGLKKRVRKIEVKRKCGGTQCIGSNVDQQTCNTGCCPVDCRWGIWGNFGKCSVSCGGGIETRTRKVITPSRCGGESCHGNSTDSRPCNNKCCPVDCVWSAWTDFSDCTATCNGGKKKRHRVKITEQKCGGEKCIGKAEETETCNKHCCPVDCELHNWGDWSRCSTSCGPNGSSVRTRKIKRVPKCGGKTCDKRLKQMMPCNQNCLHEGKILNGQCSCKPGWVGECCEKVDPENIENW